MVTKPQRHDTEYRERPRAWREDRVVGRQNRQIESTSVQVRGQLPQPTQGNVLEADAVPNISGRRRFDPSLSLCSQCMWWRYVSSVSGELARERLVPKLDRYRRLWIPGHRPAGLIQAAPTK